MSKKIIAVVVVLILASVVAARHNGVTIQAVNCTTTSAFPCIGFPGKLSGLALILTRDNAGTPTLYLPTTSGDLVTKQEVAAMIAAAQSNPTPVPSPLPSVSPTPRLLEPRVETWPSLAADKQALLTKMDQAGYKLVQVISTSAIFERKQ